MKQTFKILTLLSFILLSIAFLSGYAKAAWGDPRSYSSDEILRCKNQGISMDSRNDTRAGFAIRYACDQYLASAPVSSSVSGSSNLRLATTEEKAEIADRIYNSTCPDAIKRLILQYDKETGIYSNAAITDNLYVDGQFIVARNGSGGAPIYLTCANASYFEKLIVRIFLILFSLLALVTFYGITRSTIMIVTAFDDADKYKEGIKSLITSVAYTMGVIFAYTVFVFVAVGVIGIGVTANRTEYNIICQNRIIVNLTFDTAIDPCTP